MASTGQVQKLMEYLAAEFSTFQVTFERVLVWTEQLQRFSAQELKRGVDHFMQNSGSEYPPTVPQLIQAVRESRPQAAHQVLDRHQLRIEEAKPVSHERGLEILRKVFGERFPDVFASNGERNE